MSITGIVRTITRWALRTKADESISDSADRMICNISHIFYREKYGDEKLKNAIVEVGIKEGDLVLVHSSWRRFFNYTGTPSGVIEVLKSIVGESGIITMPSYGDNKCFFDADNSKSCAGVLSEVFRNSPGVKRSNCSHFAISLWGKNTTIIEDNCKSIYGFDEFSPCYKIACTKGAKVLFLGLGRTPHKVSVFHCASWACRNEIAGFDRIYSNYYQATVVQNGKKVIRNMVDRIPGCENDKGEFKKVVNSLKSTKRTKVSNLDVVSIDANEAYLAAQEHILNGHFLYKGVNKAINEEI